MPTSPLVQGTVECLRCGLPRDACDSGRGCPRCGYPGWAESASLTEALRRLLRDRPVEARGFRLAPPGPLR